MDTLIGMGVIFAIILLFSLFFTFCELMDRFLEGKKWQLCNLFKWWPLLIWTIYWNGIKDECRYGRVIPQPTEKKGGQIEER